ncbi:MAG: type 4a pilus biogenesis protein PilO [Dehalococcoidales bacterium]|jgi:Tfp pilus assembly protein PilO
MNMFNLTKRERLLFVVTVAAVAVWLGQRFLVKPVLDAKAGLDSKIESSTVKLEKGRRLIGREAIIKDNYNRMASMAKFSGSEEEETAKFLTEVESTAGSSGIRVNEIKPLPAQKKDLYVKFQCELEVEGEMAQIAGFMKNVRSSKSILAIEKFTLTSKQSGSNLLRCRLVVSKISIK